VMLKPVYVRADGKSGTKNVLDWHRGIAYAWHIKNEGGRAYERLWTILPDRQGVRSAG